MSWLKTFHLKELAHAPWTQNYNAIWQILFQHQVLNEIRSSQTWIQGTKEFNNLLFITVNICIYFMRTVITRNFSPSSIL